MSMKAQRETTPLSRYRTGSRMYFFMKLIIAVVNLNILHMNNFLKNAQVSSVRLSRNQSPCTGYAKSYDLII
jgi:hypothetical protein